jgi:hypothetical protein
MLESLEVARLAYQLFEPPKTRNHDKLLHECGNRRGHRTGAGAYDVT